MASGTRGNLDLNKLRDFVGPGKTLPPADLPSLRDVLAAGIYLKETAVSKAKQKDIKSLSHELTDLVMSIYAKASKEFIPGVNMIGRESLVVKIERDWRKALDIVNNKGKGIKQKKETMRDKLDRIYSVLLCQCNILSCKEEGCLDTCKKGAHIK